MRSKPAFAVEITFYKNVWFGLVELADGRRYYFLTGRRAARDGLFRYPT